MSFGLLCNGLMRGGRSSNHCGRLEGYKYVLGPNGRLTVKCRKYFCGCLAGYEDVIYGI
jgi:hypothetical protein